MLAKKWNFSKDEYEEYELPEGATTYSIDMNEIVSCARCGKKVTFGDAYTSLQIHTPTGFGYSVCEKCYEMERQEEREYQRNVQLERGITHNKVGGKQ